MGVLISVFEEDQKVGGGGGRGLEGRGRGCYYC